MCSISLLGSLFIMFAVPLIITYLLVLIWILKFSRNFANPEQICDVCAILLLISTQTAGKLSQPRHVSNLYLQMHCLLFTTFYGKHGIGNR